MMCPNCASEKMMKTTVKSKDLGGKQMAVCPDCKMAAPMPKDGHLPLKEDMTPMTDK